MRPLFVTVNPHKAEFFSKLLGFEIDSEKLDCDEIQSADPEVVIRHKLLEAYAVARRPVFVDDFSLGFDDYSGLPGPFVKFFIESENGQENFCRMADGLASRRATARAYIGYYDGHKTKIIFGELKGEIVDHPTGNAPYAIATDFIFAVDGYGGRTRAELNRQEYDEVYSKVRAIDKLIAILGKHDVS